MSEIRDGGDWDAAAHVCLLRENGGASSGYTADLIENLATALASLSAKVEELTRERDGYLSHLHQCEQIAGRALGYPRYCDDQTNFPSTTDADGVCVGEHIGDTIVAELASAFAEAHRIIAEKDKALEAALFAWGALPEGWHSKRDVQNWLIEDMKPAFDSIRAARARAISKQKADSGSERGAVQKSGPAATVPAEPSAEGWRPAETAPRDGTEFIACNLGFAPFTCRFWQGGFVHYDFDDGVIRYGFELWRPLPPAPPREGAWMAKTAFERISEGAREALEIARGNQPAARIHMQGHAYVPESELAALRQRNEELERATLGNDVAKQAERAVVAEAEAARLQAVLERIASCESHHVHDVVAIASRVLSEKKG